MTTATKIRTKAPASPPPIVNREQLLTALDKLAFVRAKIARADADAEAAIAVVKAEQEQALLPLEAEATVLFAQIQGYAETNREALLAGGGKKAAIGPHAVSWRQKPPRVELTSDAGLVLDELRKLGLQKFIAVKEAIDKRAMLAEPRTAIGVAGVDIRIGEEEFVVETVL